MKRINLRLNVTEEERDTIRKAAALTNHRSMAEFCRAIVLRESEVITRGSVAQSVAGFAKTTSVPHQDAE